MIAQVNKAQERQRIIDWARKRQPGAAAGAAALKAVEEQATYAAVRMSASAPALRASA